MLPRRMMLLGFFGLTGSLLTLPAIPQEPPPAAVFPTPVERVDFSVPFQEWATAGKRTGIPWRIEVTDAQLSFDQRLEFAVHVEVSAKSLAKLGAEYELYLLARIADENSRLLEQGWLSMKIDRVLPKRAAVVFRMPFFVVPGKYRAAVALFERKSGAYSFHAEAVEAKAVKNDPLPLAFASLPRVQVLRPSKPEEPEFLSGIRSRLDLPVRSERPVHFEVFMILGHEEQRSLRFAAPFSSFGFSMTALNVFSQLRPRDYSIHITMVDPFRRKILAEQKGVKAVDWVSLRNAIREFNPGVISAQALEGAHLNASYLRDVLTERLLETLPETNGKRPLRVVLVLGSPAVFQRGEARAPIPREMLEDSLFFHFRLQNFNPFSRCSRMLPVEQDFLLFDNYFAADDMKAILKATDARFYNLLNAHQFRDAVAHVIAAIEKQGHRRAGRSQPTP